MSSSFTQIQASQNPSHLPLLGCCVDTLIFGHLGMQRHGPCWGRWVEDAEKTDPKKMTEYPSCLINTDCMAQAISAVTKQEGGTEP